MRLALVLQLGRTFALFGRREDVWNTDIPAHNSRDSRLNNTSATLLLDSTEPLTLVTRYCMAVNLGGFRLPLESKIVSA